MTTTLTAPPTGPAQPAPTLTDEQRYPYRGDGPEVQLRINAALIGVEGLIHKIVKDKFPTISADEHDELTQRVRVSLWTNRLKYFDASRGTKLSTYVFACAAQEAGNQRREMARQGRKHRRLVPMTELDEANATAPDQSADAMIERLSDTIQAHPEKYLTRIQCRVFEAWQRARRRGPVKLKDLAKELNLSPHTTTVAMIRIRDRLRLTVRMQVAIELGMQPGSVTERMQQIKKRLRAAAAGRAE